MIIVTQSEIEALRCPLRHYYAYIQNLKIEHYPSKNYIPIGSITHGAIDKLYNMVAGGDIVLYEQSKILSELNKYIESQFDHYLSKASSNVMRQVEEDIEMAKILVRWYFKSVFMAEDYDVVKSEAVFRARMKRLSEKYKEDIYFGGKMDTIFKDIATGRIILHEIKTKSFFGPVARTEAIKGVQINSYATVLRHVKTLPSLEGIMYTVIKKPTKLKSETLDEWKERVEDLSEPDKLYNKYIQRFSFPLPAQDYVKQMEGAVEDAIMARNRAPYRRPYLCDYCDYRMLCDKMDPNAITYYTKKENPHEELYGLDVDYEVEI